ncbi:MAG TPA: hypothetical protein VGL70_21640 [Candidatus Binatia bacterium]|jgi:hypothetical protein
MKTNKAETGETQSEVARLDQQKEAQRRTVQALQRKLEAQRARKAELQKNRDEVAYAALADEDQKAQATLEAVRADLLKAALEEEELVIAIAEGERKFKEILNAREQAYIAERRAKFQSLCVAKKDAARKAEEAMKKMIQAEKEEQAINEQIAPLAQELGVSKHFGRHFRESLEAQIYMAFGFGQYPAARTYMEKSYSEIIDEYLAEFFEEEKLRKAS